LVVARLLSEAGDLQTVLLARRHKSVALIEHGKQ
jgi:hypothetical protein